MNLKDITIVVAVDELYMEKLWWSYQTWIKFKPEINDIPLLVIYDNAKVSPGLGTVHPRYGPEWSGDPHSKIMAFQRLTYQLGRKARISWKQWDMPVFFSQREKMLTSLVFVPAEIVATPWYLKLDADTYANESKTWINDHWFQPIEGQLPAFAASPWGYTKPGNLLDTLDDWGDAVEPLKRFPRLNIPHEPNSRTVASNRMASWVMFGNTGWLKEVVKTCPDKRLPVPSQDTFLYYVAARRGDHYVRERMNRHGWAHASKMRSLLSECQKLLGRDAIYPVWTGQ